jgi:hypothetical protein
MTPPKNEATMPIEIEERSFVQISPEMQAIIDRRPPHWESLLLQAVLRSMADKINSGYAKANRGENAYSFICWMRTFLDKYGELMHELLAVFENELPAATGQRGEAADADSIVTALDHFVSVVHDAIVLQERAVFLSRHPVFGELAEYCRDMAKPFVDSYNDFLRNLDEQLPTIDQTGRLRLNLNLQAPPAMNEFLSGGHEQYLSSKFLECDGSERRDVVIELFNIARGTETLGEFGRSAIRDNLRNGLFRADDWYWSYENEQWKPLCDLGL